ncbi:MAG: hypothetical protein Q7T08_10655 [Devosia sp.]|nr:hypothetical protein [Devosia sp.]
MFGFFKKTISPVEFGQAVTKATLQSLCNDAARSIGMRFENFDASHGWGPFLESHGLSKQAQALHARLFIHCAMQAAFSAQPNPTKFGLMQGVLNCFVKDPAGYDFESTYIDLEQAYIGRGVFAPAVDQLSDSQEMGVLNSKYLLQAFVVPYVPNRAPFYEQFEAFCLPARVAIVTVNRAMHDLNPSFKMASAG